VRRTKIIATVGPACTEPKILAEMIQAGVNLFRFNFSHNLDGFEKTIKKIRAIGEQYDKPISIIGDLQGPKIRIGSFKNGHVELKDNQSFTLLCEADNNNGDDDFVCVDYLKLCHEINPGDVLLLDDGLIELLVKKISGNNIECMVKTGGILANKKGINRQGGGLSACALTEKDYNDIANAISNDIDYIAISFAKDANDINLARNEINKHNANTGIIAKIERSEALSHLDEIIMAADAVMVARGDLGVEIGAAEVPAIQKQIIERALFHDKPVITATQMMESMITSPKPTRAEVSDVANAILDGTDAVMLSAETATGKFPVKVIDMMDKICRSTEKHTSSHISFHKNSCRYLRSDEAIAMATIYTANHFLIKAIITLTESGTTPLWMSRVRSNIPIIALTRNVDTLGKMVLYSNVFPQYYDFSSIEPQHLNAAIIDFLKGKNLIQCHDKILFTRGSELYTAGHTNTMMILDIS
jgi:pyruvate kinase